MNIFILDYDHGLNASYHVDAHARRMMLEYAQLLCTARHCFGDNTSPYKPTHVNHPCAVWVREAKENYLWLCELGLALSAEYEHRFRKKHACETVIRGCAVNVPKAFPLLRQTSFVQCMPDAYKTFSPVTAYRRYCKEEKRHLAKWTARPIPEWWHEN